MALCVTLAYAEPETEAWGEIRNPIVAKPNGVLGGGFNGRKKRSADPEHSAEPEAAAWYGFRPYPGNRQHGG